MKVYVQRKNSSLLEYVWVINGTQSFGKSMYKKIVIWWKQRWGRFWHHSSEKINSKRVSIANNKASVPILDRNLKENKCQLNISIQFFIVKIQYNLSNYILFLTSAVITRALACIAEPRIAAILTSPCEFLAILCIIFVIFARLCIK